MNIEVLSSTADVSGILTTVITAILAFIPKLLAAIVIVILTKMFAKSIANIVTKALEAIHIKKVIDGLELGFTVSPSTEAGVIKAASLISRYAVLYIGTVFTLQVLGLTEIADFLLGLLSIMPQLISAAVILLIGVILAGIVEGVVKKALMTFDPATARLGGKIASYTVVSLFALMSLSELGIATTIINPLFIGMVASFSLAFALSIGLGSKDLVKTVLEKWYTTRRMPLSRGPVKPLKK